MKDVLEVDYLSALEACARISEAEAAYAQEVFSQSDALSQQLEQAFDAVESRAPRSRDADGGSQEIRTAMRAEIARLRRERDERLQAQQETLSSFNIMLFGRTMSGKSTLREALTQGDGASIGQGAQRTTRDLRAYAWRGLRIVDTPGFGAYGGEKDAEIAHQALEQADLALFLLNSDSIQETAFDELKYAHQLNKPLVFALNMKKNLEDSFILRRALKDPARIYKPEDIKAHEDRLRGLLERAGFSGGSLRILPIHAQAAFLATRSQDDEERAALSALSRIGDLFALLQQEVGETGTARRVQNFSASTLRHLEEHSLLLQETRQKLQDPLLLNYQATLKRIDAWRSGSLRGAPARLAAAVEQAYQPLFATAGGFIEDHIEDPQLAELWSRHIASFNVESAIGEALKEIVAETLDEFAQLQRDMNLEFSLNARPRTKAKPYDDFDYKRIFNWGGALLGLAQGLRFIPPLSAVGWIATGISIVAGFFFSSKKDKLNKAKAEARAQLLAGLEAGKSAACAEVQRWFETSIAQGALLDLEKELRRLSATLQGFCVALDAKIQALEALRREVDSRRLQRIFALLSGEAQKAPALLGLARRPGEGVFCLVSEACADRKPLKRMEAMLQEKMTVVHGRDLRRRLGRLFGGAARRIEKLSACEAALHVRPEDLPKIYGPQGQRLQMASELFSCRISIVPTEA